MEKIKWTEQQYDIKNDDYIYDQTQQLWGGSPLPWWTRTIMMIISKAGGFLNHEAWLPLNLHRWNSSSCDAFPPALLSMAPIVTLHNYHPECLLAEFQTRKMVFFLGGWTGFFFFYFLVLYRGGEQRSWRDDIL